MNTSELGGTARKLKGRLKEAAGVVTGNRQLENEGITERADGAVEAGLGKARRKVGEALSGIADAIKK